MNASTKAIEDFVKWKSELMDKHGEYDGSKIMDSIKFSPQVATFAREFHLAMHLYLSEIFGRVMEHTMMLLVEREAEEEEERIKAREELLNAFKKRKEGA